MSDEESEEEEWEDVPQSSSSQLQDVAGVSGGDDLSESRSLEIVVESGNAKDKGKGKLVCDKFKKALAAAERERYRHTHQLNLLALLARGILLSLRCSDHTLQAILLSVLGADAPGIVLESPESCSKGYLNRLLKWLSLNMAKMQDAFYSELPSLKDESDSFFSGQNLESPMIITEVVIMVAILRAIGLRGRLVSVLGPLAPLKPPSVLVGTNGKGRKGKKGSGGKDKKGTKEEELIEDKEELGRARKSSEGEGLGERLLRFNIEQEMKAKNRNRVKREKEDQEFDEYIGETKKYRKNNKGKKSTTSSRTKQKSGSNVKSSTGKRTKSSSVDRGSSKKKKKSPSGSSDVSYTELSSSGDEFEPEPTPRKRKKVMAAAPPVKKMKFNRPNQDGEKEGVAGGSGQNKEVELVRVEETGSWAEVYVPAMKKWVCLHLPSGSVDQPKLCEKHCCIPLHYILAFEHEDDTSASCYVTDVTARYASDWLTSARKSRVDEKWWEETLRPFRPPSMVEIMQENEDIAARLSSKNLPLSIAEYKNHPLYALRRHLLKFEALYPSDCEVLGYCKGDPVYSRKNVHTLHTRETWLKRARLVRRDEEPYNKVKARPKKGQGSDDVAMAELYGRWQTEAYMPPLVVDGKIPRNEYGNVDMYQNSMLPVGGAHLREVGIAKVARKLGIDSAPAVVGFEFHGGHSHPIIDGVIVPEDCTDILLEAWETEQQIAMEKEKSKRMKRVMDRWRRLSRALLIRSRVHEQFNIINS